MPVTTLNTKQTEYKPNARLLGNLDGFASALNSMESHPDKGIKPVSWDKAPRKTYTPRASWRPTNTEVGEGKAEEGGAHPFLHRPQRNVLSFGKPPPRPDRPQYPSESGPRPPRGLDGGRRMDGPGRGTDGPGRRMDSRGPDGAKDIRAPRTEGTAPPKRAFRQPDAQAQLPTWASRTSTSAGRGTTTGRGGKSGGAKRPRRARSSNSSLEDDSSSRSPNPLADLTPEEAQDMGSIANFASDGNGSVNLPRRADFQVTEVSELGRLGGARVVGGNGNGMKGLSSGEKAGDYSRFGVKGGEGEAVDMARFVLAQKKDTGVDARKVLVDLIRSSTAVPKASSTQLLEGKKATAA